MLQVFDLLHMANYVFYLKIHCHDRHHLVDYDQNCFQYYCVNVGFHVDECCCFMKKKIKQI